MSEEIKNQVIRFLLGECEHPETGECFSLANNNALSGKILKRYWWRKYLRNETLSYEQTITHLTKRVEELESVVESAIATFKDYEMSVDDYPTQSHRAFIRLLQESLCRDVDSPEIFEGTKEALDCLGVSKE